MISPVFATAKMVIAMNIQAGNQGAARATTSTSGALEIHAFPRVGDVPVSEVTSGDVLAGVWTIPASRMKTGREHRVPLCGRALAILRAARRRGDRESPVVFVNERGRPLDGKRLNRLLGKHRIAAVPHGFRSSFRDWAAEETDHPREVVETLRQPPRSDHRRSADLTATLLVAAVKRVISER